MMKKETRRRIANKLTESNGVGDALGAVVYWGFNDLRVFCDDFLAIISKNGLDPAIWGPSPITGANPVRKAIKRVMGKKKAADFLCRKVLEGTDKIVWRIVEEKTDEAAEDLSYSSSRPKLVFDKTTETLTVTCNSNGVAKELAEEIEATYIDYTSHFISRDIQGMLVRNVLELLQGVSMRPGGGMYYVPPQGIPTLEKLQAIVEDENIEAKTNELGLIVFTAAHKATVKSVTRDTSRGLEAELVKLKDKIEDFKTNPPRSDALQNKLEEFKDLQRKVDLYKGVLNLQTTDLETGINDCTQVVANLLGMANARKEEKATERDSNQKVEVKVDAPSQDEFAALKSRAAERAKARRLKRK